MNELLERWGSALGDAIAAGCGKNVTITRTERTSIPEGSLEINLRWAGEWEGRVAISIREGEAARLLDGRQDAGAGDLIPRWIAWFRAVAAEVPELPPPVQIEAAEPAGAPVCAPVCALTVALDPESVTLLLGGSLHRRVPPQEAPGRATPPPDFVEPPRELERELEHDLEHELQQERTIPRHIDLLLDVEVDASLRFGAREISIRELLDTGPGDVLELDRHITDPVDLIVGDKIVARGEVVLVNGNFGLRITEVAEPKKCLESVRCLF